MSRVRPDGRPGESTTPERARTRGVPPALITTFTAPVPDTRARTPKGNGGGTLRAIIRGLGELCITAGLILLLFMTYELWGTGRYTREQQDRLSDELLESWSAPAQRVTTERVRLGKGLALLRIPKLGDDYRYVVIEGVEPGDLRKGPGHYPGSALPGQLGNFVVSGHRTTYSAPFNRIDKLDPGDRILVDTRRKQYVYKVTGHRIVRPSAVEVTAPVPFHPRRKPTQRLITLTTCHPKYSAAKRLIVFGTLVEERPRRPATATAG
ncbi:MAG TPA: class E sortase [Thermomonospora sp.]|nr:class E sortase [Thermomonospora sp.]